MGSHCHTVVTWAKDKGVLLHPTWYSGLTASSSFTDFQTHLHNVNPADCPLPCTQQSGCIAPKACKTAVLWAMEKGITLHPTWYNGLTKESSFEEFQAAIHRGAPTKCPMPCESMITATTAEAITETRASTTSEVISTTQATAATTEATTTATATEATPSTEVVTTTEAVIKATSTEAANTATEAESVIESTVTPFGCVDVEMGSHCHTVVTWAKDKGVLLHPTWYSGLTASSSFTDFQTHLHNVNPADCPLPCTQQSGCIAPKACKTAVLWAMEKGISLHPTWYSGLTKESSFEEFQAAIHIGAPTKCPMPCD